MKRPTRASIVMAGAAVTLVAVLAGPASASSAGGSLPAGSSMCTDRTMSDDGVNVSGTVTTPSAQVTWTVREADTATGAETEVFRSVGYDVTGRQVASPHAGRLFYRLCLANTTRSSVSFSHAALTPRPGFTDAQQGVGPTTAVLGGGQVCGELIKGSGRLIASASSPVTWFVRAYNGDGTILRSIQPLTVTSASVNQVVGPGAYAFLDVCAINHSTTTATLSMEFAVV
jgi:hypothetical protein